MLASGLADIGVRRLIHCSSIDVYGSANAAWIDEDVLPEPRTDYAREQLAAEACVHAAPIETCVVRLGAVFGAGGRNMVSIAHEARHAPLSKLIARRALYGDRRMHLVSVEKVADVLRFLALSDHWFDRERILVTDDDASENNFAFVQDELLKSFGRPTLSWVPSLPSQVLSLGLRILGRANTDPTRRISSKKLTALGFHPSVTFRERLERYADCSGSAGEDGIQ
jgi:nucleoside-diphosphate-sugar epimerase